MIKKPCIKSRKNKRKYKLNKSFALFKQTLLNGPPEKGCVTTGRLGNNLKAVRQIRDDATSTKDEVIATQG